MVLPVAGSKVGDGGALLLSARACSCCPTEPLGDAWAITSKAQDRSSSLELPHSSLKVGESGVGERRKGEGWGCSSPLPVSVVLQAAAAAAAASAGLSWMEFVRHPGGGEIWEGGREKSTIGTG